MKKKFILIAIVAVLTVLICSQSVAFADEQSDSYKQSKAYQFVRDFCANYPDRQGGSTTLVPAENSVQKYLLNKMNEFSQNKAQCGFDKFTFDNSTYYFNLTARLNVPSSDKQIIIGAHYDSVGQGAGDNACGVATLLLILENLSANIDKLPCDVTFVLFDAEETGLNGSSFFVQSMTDAQKENTLAMINIDSIGNGDNLYLHCENKHTDLADLIIANSNGISEKPYAKGTYNLNDPYGYGYYEKIQGSDHTPFRLAGIPVAFFFSGTYDTVGWNYAESSDPAKQVMNTTSDTFENLDKNNGSAFVNRINAVVQAVCNTVTDAKFAEVGLNARNQLVNLKVWYRALWPYLIVLVALIIIIVLIVLHYRKLQKMSIIGTAEVKTQSVFTTPDAEDIFTFKD